jgi:small subunit ribosomal protein S7
MPRKRLVARRGIEPDPRFNSVLVSKFVNGLMECGKKSIARGIFYGAMDMIEVYTEADPIVVFEKALKSASRLEVKSRRVGGATIRFQSVRRRNAYSLACYGPEKTGQNHG